MKPILFILLILLTGHQCVTAQKVPYNVVFDVTTKDTVVHQMVIRWINEILSTDPMANIEVVYYAKSLDMVTQCRSVVAADVEKFAARKNVSFKVCQVAMKNNNIELSQLLPGVSTVPDGIYEIISRQHDGWGYIKASR